MKMVYVSVDGKEFSNEEECRRYEDVLGWKNMNKVRMNSIYTGAEYNTEDNLMYLVKPQTDFEIGILNEIDNATYLSENRIGKEDIGKYYLVVITEYGYDKDECNFYDAEACYVESVEQLTSNILNEYVRAISELEKEFENGN